MKRKRAGLHPLLISFQSSENASFQRRSSSHKNLIRMDFMFGNCVWSRRGASLPPQKKPAAVTETSQPRKGASTSRISFFLASMRAAIFQTIVA
ncbi:hypothetical protein [Ensifer sp. MJa1]|uniref:hypothetical protein n=1 Tax=Ensifer sp. MJa1 TaxID=2919888 RepID=UPI00300B5FE6